MRLLHLISKSAVTTCFMVLILFSLRVQARQNKEINRRILVLFNTEQGGTYKLALAIASGIEKMEGTKAVLKQIPRIKPLQNEKNMDFSGVPYASIEDLTAYDGIAFGSPVHFGNMSADMRSFLDQSVAIWTARKLEGIPATVFMSAGSGAGREAAVLSFWNTLALHGMIIVPTGIMGNMPFGVVSIAGTPGAQRPSPGELHLAQLQGYALARVVKGCAPLHDESPSVQPAKNDIETRLKDLGITLPEAPAPVGSYKTYKRTGNLILINQIALKAGHIEHPGMIDKEVTTEQARQATRQTLLNILAVLKDAAGGDLNKVKQAVQLTGYFYTPAGYSQHAALMNEASDLLVAIFGEKGLHTRATVGASSLPMNSAVEIQAIFELE
eukprot:gene14729-17406_t